MSVPTFTATLTAFLSIVGGNGVNEQSVPIASLQNPASPGNRLNVTLNSGDNQISPFSAPQNPAAMCIVVFQTPPGTVTLKGVGADTGYLMTGGPLGALGQFVLVLPIGNSTTLSASNPGSFILNVSVQTTATIYFI